MNKAQRQLLNDSHRLIMDHLYGTHPEELTARLAPWVSVSDCGVCVSLFAQFDHVKQEAAR